MEHLLLMQLTLLLICLVRQAYDKHPEMLDVRSTNH